jgi:general secretion pathway protein G
MYCNRTVGAIHTKGLWRQGFSFIEIMIVVVIIGILAGAVTLSARHYLDKAKVNRARSDIATYSSALSAFYAENGNYPTSDQGLTALEPKFIDKLRLDPWGHAYAYNQPGRTGPYEIICYGADGKEGGDGADADISSEDVDTQGTAK